MRKSILLPAIALLGGVIGLLVRRLYLSTGFEPDTGLPLSGVPAFWGMWAVVLLVLVLLLVLGRGWTRSFERDFTAAFLPRAKLAQAAVFAGAFLLVASGFIHLEAFISSPVNYLGRREIGLMRAILGVLSILGGASVLLTAKTVAAKKPTQSAALTLPGFAACFWAMANYKGWAKDPVLCRYALPLLAVLLTLVACCLLAGFAFGKGNVTAAVFTSLLGSCLCIMALGDGLPLYEEVLCMAFAFYLLGMGGLLAENASRPVPPPVAPCNGCEGCSPDSGAPVPPNCPNSRPN